MAWWDRVVRRANGEYATPDVRDSDAGVEEDDDDFDYNMDSALAAGFGTSLPDSSGRGKAWGW